MWVKFTQAKKGFPSLCCRLMKSLAGGDEFVVAGLHSLRVEWARILDLLLSDLAPPRFSVVSSLSVAYEWMTPAVRHVSENFGNSFFDG